MGHENRGVTNRSGVHWDLIGKEVVTASSCRGVPALHEALYMSALMKAKNGFSNQNGDHGADDRCSLTRKWSQGRSFE